jgi:hypothetical protein
LEGVYLMSAFNSDSPLLDARLEGKKYTATANSTTPHYFYFTRDCVFNGVEIYVKDANFDDEIELLTEYTTDGGTTWVRYKRFGKTFNVAPNLIQRYVLLPANPSLGVRVRINYKNTGNTDVKFWANYYVFTDLEEINPALGQQGEDW